LSFLQLLIGCLLSRRGVLPAVGVGLLAAGNFASAKADAGIHAVHGMVASDSRLASQAGVRVLAAGGNAADAACATALALGVVNPFASGLGGGGFALIYSANTGKVEALDFRETAPAALRPDLFLREGKIERAWSVRGGLAVGVPGEPAGLAELVRRWGKRPFARCIEPAETLARGFQASAWLVEHVADDLKQDPSEAAGLLARVLARKRGSLAELRAGDVVRRPDLAGTLARLRRGGAAAFYRGEIASAIVSAVQNAGGVIDRSDLAGYTPVGRTPLVTTFRGRRIFAMPPPSAGGVVMFEVLGILGERMKNWDPVPAGPQDPTYLHVLVETLKHGFADRSRFLGDPGFVSVPLSHLLDASYHRELQARIRPDGILAPDRYGSAEPSAAAPARDAGTAHISVVDSEGNAVALTTTINLEFGAHLVAGRTGVLLNDEMDDFSLAPGAPDAFGLVAGGQNLLAPGKRPLSSMSPTIVVGENGVEMVLGAAGGPMIISSTVEVLLDVLVFGMDAQAAQAVPRVHHQWSPDVLRYEPGLPMSVVDSLRTKGHRVEARDKIGKVNVVIRGKAGLAGAGEPRSGGAPAGF
jgi:gamma-glutamyltranspeptidase/glutathione hydrolase